MTRIENMAAQGDVLFRRIEQLPDGVSAQPAKDGRHLLAHSETGHHHTCPETGVKLYSGTDPMICYLQIDDTIPGIEITHHRDYATHAPLLLTPGLWEVRRQREHTPEGWRMVED